MTHRDSQRDRGSRRAKKKTNACIHTYMDENGRDESDNKRYCGVNKVRQYGALLALTSLMLSAYI